MAAMIADQGYYIAHTTVHFSGEAGQRSEVVHIGPAAFSDIFKVGNTEIAQVSSATVTKYEASPSIKGRPTSLNFHDGDNNELEPIEQGGYIVTADRVQEVHVNLQAVDHGNPPIHVFNSAIRPMADIRADRDAGIAKMKYNLDHKPDHGVQVVRATGGANVYVCAKGDGSPLSTFIESNPHMALKDPETGKPEVHTIDTVEHHVVDKQNYEVCMQVLSKLLKKTGAWSKGIKLTHTIHGGVPSEDWRATAHIEWNRPRFGDPKKNEAVGPRFRSAVSVVRSLDVEVDELGSSVKAQTNISS